MKLHQTILLILAITFFSCEDNAPKIEDQEPAYFLSGVINNWDSLNLEYYEMDDAPRYVSASQTPSNDMDMDDHYLNVFESGFYFDRSYHEDITMHYQFKFDKENHSCCLLSYINDLDQLEELMITGEWGFGETYTKTEKYIDIYYESWPNIAPRHLYSSKFTSDSLTNSVSDFAIESVERYDHRGYGPGLRITGNFDCVLYNYEDLMDSIVMDNMKFRGFVLLQYCGRQGCQ